ncbi:hypothetical protein [Amycolatopsis sp. MtRt-6]|uniref:hypothetical protein n=1 Tax=Amycolatopsis sp. MtRt-6 TaxID=2792782 RepID=UPI001A8D2213|nr:hypothetical protein [Amycolatopsis sp. MtRt-6]
MLRWTAITAATAAVVAAAAFGAGTGADKIVSADDPPTVCLRPHAWGCDPGPPDPWEWD